MQKFNKEFSLWKEHLNNTPEENEQRSKDMKSLFGMGVDCSGYGVMYPLWIGVRLTPEQVASKSYLAKNLWILARSDNKDTRNVEIARYSKLLNDAIADNTIWTKSVETSIERQVPFVYAVMDEKGGVHDYPKQQVAKIMLGPNNTKENIELFSKEPVAPYVVVKYPEHMPGYDREKTAFRVPVICPRYSWYLMKNVLNKARQAAKKAAATPETTPAANGDSAANFSNPLAFVAPNPAPAPAPVPAETPAKTVTKQTKPSKVPKPAKPPMPRPVLAEPTPVPAPQVAPPATSSIPPTPTKPRKPANPQKNADAGKTVDLIKKAKGSVKQLKSKDEESDGADSESIDSESSEEENDEEDSVFEPVPSSSSDDEDAEAAAEEEAIRADEDAKDAEIDMGENEDETVENVEMAEEEDTDESDAKMAACSGDFPTNGKTMADVPSTIMGPAARVYFAKENDKRVRPALFLFLEKDKKNRSVEERLAMLPRTYKSRRTELKSADVNIDVLFNVPEKAPEPDKTRDGKAGDGTPKKPKAPKKPKTPKESEPETQDKPATPAKSKKSKTSKRPRDEPEEEESAPADSGEPSFLQKLSDRLVSKKSKTANKKLRRDEVFAQYRDMFGAPNISKFPTLDFTGKEDKDMVAKITECISFVVAYLPEHENYLKRQSEREIAKLKKQVKKLEASAAEPKSNGTVSLSDIL